VVIKLLSVSGDSAVFRLILAGFAATINGCAVFFTHFAMPERISSDSSGITPRASGPTLTRRLPPLLTHSTSFLIRSSLFLKFLSVAQCPQLLFMVMQTSHTTGRPFSSRMPAGGMICSGLTKSPEYSLGESVTREPKPSPLTSRRLYNRCICCRTGRNRHDALRSSRHISYRLP